MSSLPEKGPAALKEQYLAYIDCLNSQEWHRLGDFVHEDAIHNGVAFGLSGYRRMLEGDFTSIPDLHFEVTLLACEPPYISSRLRFDCTPVGTLFGLAVNGRRVRFHENVFYHFVDGRIGEVWSIIDRAEIAVQL